jgi:hypothetical protein
MMPLWDVAVGGGPLLRVPSGGRAPESVGGTGYSDGSDLLSR